MIVKSRETLANGNVIIEFANYKELISPPTQQWTPSWCINKYGYYEKEFTEAVHELVKPGFVALDVGANMGYYTVMMASLVGPAGKVIAFEPIKEPVYYLKESLQLNDFNNTQLFDTCLGDTSGEISFDRTSCRLNVSNKKVQLEMVVSIRPFDEMASEIGVSKVDLAKIDVEGAEFNVLRGMKNTLQKHGPHLLIEIHPAMIQEFGASAEEMLSFLSEMGYKTKPLDQTELNLDVPNNLHVHCYRTDY